MQNQQYFRRLVTLLIDDDCSISFEAKKERIECTVNKGQVEVRAMSKNAPLALYLAWEEFKKAIEIKNSQFPRKTICRIVRFLRLYVH